MTEPRTIVLPLPPSTNTLFINAGPGRRKSKRYRAWIKEAGWTLKATGPWRIGGPIRVAITIPRDMPGDADNRVKGLLDILVTHDRIDDDRNVQSVSVTRCAAVEAGQCRVVVEAAA